VLISATVMSRPAHSASAPSVNAPPKSVAAEMKMQALVMSMADDYIASLGEAVYLLIRSGTPNAKARSLAQ
jgi:hypothetical protein